jgi:hypothetical protein
VLSNFTRHQSRQAFSNCQLEPAACVQVRVLCKTLLLKTSLAETMGSNPTPYSELSRFYHVCPDFGHTARYLRHRTDCKQKR